MVDPATADERNRSRAAQNPRRALAHGAAPVGRPLPAGRSSEPISLGAPSICIDTSDGYDPGLADIVAFVDQW